MIKPEKACTSIEQVFERKTPALSLIRKQLGERVSLAYVKAWIVWFASEIRLDGLSETQIDIAASIIVSEFYMLTPADIQLVFRKAFAGSFGKHYHRLDSTMIIEFFRKYLDERLNAAELVSSREHQAAKSWTDTDGNSFVEKAYKRDQSGRIVANPDYQPEKNKPSGFTQRVSEKESRRQRLQDGDYMRYMERLSKASDNDRRAMLGLKPAEETDIKVD